MVGKVVLFALMFASFGGMLWANRKSKMGVIWGKPVAALLGILAVIFAVSTMIRTERTKEIIETEVRFQRASFEVFGKEIAKRYPKATILLIRHRPVRTAEGISEQVKARMDGLRAGLGGLGIASEEFVMMHPEAAEPTEPMMDPSMMFTAERMDEMIENNSHCDLVLCLDGLPMGFERMKLWKKKKEERPVIAVVGGIIHTLKGAVKMGAVGCIMARKPTKFDPDAKCPDDIQKAFDTRYLMVTPDSIEEIHATYPHLFKEVEAPRAKEGK